ncbi:hypothetical protein ALT721_2320078 [Alteromonas alvinellae]
MLLESLVSKCEIRFIPIKYFDLIALFIAEDEQCTAKRIKVHIPLN